MEWDWLKSKCYYLLNYQTWHKKCYGVINLICSAEEAISEHMFQLDYPTLTRRISVVAYPLRYQTITATRWPWRWAGPAISISISQSPVRRKQGYPAYTALSTALSVPENQLSFLKISQHLFQLNHPAPARKRGVRTSFWGITLWPSTATLCAKWGLTQPTVDCRCLVITIRNATIIFPICLIFHDVWYAGGLMLTSHRAVLRRVTVYDAKKRLWLMYCL